MHERFDLEAGRGPGDPPHFVERGRPFHDQPREARLVPEAGAGRVHVEHLRRGVQLDRRQVHTQKSGILHDQRIGSGLVHIAGDPLGLGQLALVDERVHS